MVASFSFSVATGRLASCSILWQAIGGRSVHSMTILEPEVSFMWGWWFNLLLCSSLREDRLPLGCVRGSHLSPYITCPSSTVLFSLLWLLRDLTLPPSNALGQRLKGHCSEWQQHFIQKKVIITKLVKHFYWEEEMQEGHQSRQTPTKLSPGSCGCLVGRLMHLMEQIRERSLVNTNEACF